MASTTDRIEKTIVLRASVDRVWRAISDAKRFGTWFGVELDGDFVAGQRVTGRIVPTQVDPEVAKVQEPYAGAVFECTVDRIEPMRLFSFRWNPLAMDRREDEREYSTVVVFELEEVAGGTKLSITESGFDRLPLERGAESFRRNEQGWAGQVKLIEKYLAADGQA